MIEELKQYLELGLEIHRATRQDLINQGKTYRSHRVSFENGVINTIQDVLSFINRPERESQLREAMSKTIKKDWSDLEIFLG